MDNTTHEPTPIPEPEPGLAPPQRTHRSMLGGAVLGVVALTASVVGISAIAGAQDEPEVDTDNTMELGDDEMGDEIALESEDDAVWAAFDQCIDEAFSALEISEDPDGEALESELSEEQFGAAEKACEDLLPEEIKAELAAWQPFEDCVDGQIESLGLDEEDAKEGEAIDVEDAELAGMEEQWEAIEAACKDLLPEDVKAQADAFTAYEDCLADAGVSEELATAVYVEDGERGQSIAFGEAGGSVTVTGDSNGVSVETNGDVSVIDDEAFESAFESCEQLLPQDMFDDEGIEAEEVPADEDGADEDGDDEDGEED
ncbi:MAG: hypothetical protein AAGA37_07300 [Actinomycetota bacterium]